MSTPRNAECPCGSKKKYKRCCGANEVAAENAGMGGAGIAAGGTSKVVPILMFASAIGVGVGVGTLRSAIADGLAVSLALCVGVAMYLMARNPPESTGRGGGAAINFGMDKTKKSNRQAQSQSRSFGPPNRSSRRRK